MTRSIYSTHKIPYLLPDILVLLIRRFSNHQRKDSLGWEQFVFHKSMQRKLLAASFLSSKHPPKESTLNTAESPGHHVHETGPIQQDASGSRNAEVHIFAIQHQNGFSSSISYKCCFVLIFNWTSWNLLSNCQGCIFSKSNMASLPLPHCPCHL